MSCVPEESPQEDTVVEEDSTQPPIATVLGQKEEFKFVLEFCTFEEVLKLDVALSNSEAGLLYLRQNCGRLEIKLAEDLKNSAGRGDMDAAEALLKRGVPAGIAVGSLFDGFVTPLCAAAMRGNHKMVSRLLEAGVDVNWRDETGVSALDFATVRARSPSLRGGSTVPLSADADFSETIRILRLFGGKRYESLDYGDY